MKSILSYLDHFPQTCQEASIIPLILKCKVKSRFLIHHKGEENTFLSPKNLNHKFNVPMECKQLVECFIWNEIKLASLVFMLWEALQISVSSPCTFEDLTCILFKEIT